MPVAHLLRDPVIMVLLAASLASWAIILDRVLALWRARRADAAFRRGAQVDAPLAALRAERQRHEGAGRDHLLTLMDTAITLRKQRLERALPLLGVIGSTAPYVGLLGTVIGIIQAFHAIQVANNMTTSAVANGIATALVATATGLAVAIPAVAAHHLLTSALSRMVAGWEAVVAEWLPDDAEVGHEPVARA